MPDTQKTKVLILDDEHFLLDMYRIIFEKNGYEVTTFDSADNALTALRSGYDPDVILFDITMPGGMSGYEFLEEVRKEKLTQRSMKIALTNEGQDAEKARLAELGADGHLLKANFVPSQLAATVTGMLEKRRESPQRA
jgi:CheY-like chemotaxis protein